MRAHVSRVVLIVAGVDEGLAPVEQAGIGLQVHIGGVGHVVALGLLPADHGVVVVKELSSSIGLSLDQVGSVKRHRRGGLAAEIGKVWPEIVELAVEAVAGI